MGKTPPPPLFPTEPPKKDADHKHKIKLPEPIIPPQTAKPATVGATPPPGQLKPKDVDHKHKVKLPPIAPVGQSAPAAGSTAVIAPKPAAGPGAVGPTPVGAKPGPVGSLPTVGAKLATGAKPGAGHPPGGLKPPPGGSKLPPGHPLAGKPQKVPPKFPHSANVLTGFRKLFNNYSSEGRGNAAKATLAGMVLAYVMYRLGQTHCDVEHSHSWQEERLRLHEAIERERAILKKDFQKTSNEEKLEVPKGLASKGRN